MLVIATTLLACAVTAACSNATAPDDELRDARQLWARQGPASYSLTLFRSCECTPEMTGPVVVMVRNGAIESRHYTTNGATVPVPFAFSFPTVEGLFQIIDDAIALDPYQLEVRYDARLGYPTLISVDFDRRIADDEFSYTVSLDPR
jgi:hypothetical protein